MSEQHLKNLGLKVTSPRLKILEIFETKKPQHFSAEEIYQLLAHEGEDVALATIYRVLTQFESAGLLIRHHFEGGTSVFELNDGVHHDHLVCVKCGFVEEFVDDVIELRQQEIAKQSGFKMTDHSLNIYGVCQNCQV